MIPFSFKPIEQGVGGVSRLSHSVSQFIDKRLIHIEAVRSISL